MKTTKEACPLQGSTRTPIFTSCSQLPQQQQDQQLHCHQSTNPQLQNQNFDQKSKKSERLHKTKDMWAFYFA